MPLLDLNKDTIARVMPKYNPAIADGVAYSQMDYPNVEEYIDAILRCWVEDLNKNFEYCGYDRCSPIEQIRALSTLPNCANTLAVEKNDVYMIKIKLKYKGEYLPHRYMLLPIIERGGKVNIRDTSYYIYGIIADNFFSVENDSIHITLTKTKFNVNMVEYSFNLGTLQTFCKCPYAQLYKVPNDERPSGKSKKSLFANYLCAYYGITNTIKMFFGGIDDFYFGLDGIDVRNPKNPVDIFKLDTEKYYICTSSGDSQMYRKAANKTSKSPFVFAINKDDYNTPGIKEFITSLFFMFDRLFDRSNTKASWFYAPEHLDSQIYWRRALIFFLFKPTEKEREYLAKIDIHLYTVSTYIENIVLRRIKNEDLPISNMSELMVYIMENHNKIFSERNPADCSKKHIVTIPYVLFDIVVKLTNIIYKFNQFETKGNLTLKNINDTLSKMFPTDTILTLGSGHGEVNFLEMSNDCLPFKTTTNVMTQTKASAANKDSKNSNQVALDPQNKIHPSMIDVFSCQTATKANPTGRGKLNPYQVFKANGQVQPIPELDKIRSNLYELIISEEFYNEQSSE